MLIDSTEEIRREMVDQVNRNPCNRADLEAVYGQVWDAKELCQDFTVLGFLAPFIVVDRKSDGKRGSLLFQHNPRFYFKFEEYDR